MISYREERPYKKLLKNVADYGHGVFTLTIMQNRKERDALKKWVYRNPSYIRNFLSRPREIKIFTLSQLGMKVFNAQDDLSQGSAYTTFLDMALANAYMVETENFTRYKNQSHITLNYEQENVGLVSFSWGLRDSLEGITKLITVNHLKKHYLKLLENQPSEADHKNKMKTIELLKNAHIPAAFRHYRKI